MEEEEEEEKEEEEHGPTKRWKKERAKREKERKKKHRRRVSRTDALGGLGRLFRHRRPRFVFGKINNANSLPIIVLSIMIVCVVFFFLYRALPFF